LVEPVEGHIIEKDMEKLASDPQCMMAGPKPERTTKVSGHLQQKDQELGQWKMLFWSWRVFFCCVSLSAATQQG